MKTKNNEHEHHEFAFYYPAVFQTIERAQQTPSSYLLADKELCHRITTILRLTEDESFILFDELNNIQCTIAEQGKKIKLQCGIPQKNKQLSPHITFLLPLLKRDAFEAAIYSLTELGANVIQPVITQKANRSWQGAKEHERMKRIMQAAAEQSKNFAIPTLEQPLTFAKLDALFNTAAECIFFDPEGKPLADTVKSIPQGKDLILMVGPEGDLTAEEKMYLQKMRAHFCALTPTILRAEQAVAIALGSIRSLT